MCIDKGVNFMEARVKQSLKELLSHPDDEKVRDLLLTALEQENLQQRIILLFSFGGIGLSTSVVHKLFDSHTYFLFIKAWAAATRGSPKYVFPSFVASQLFPNNPNLNYSWPSKFNNTESVSIERFMFDSDSIATLRHQAGVNTSNRGPTHMEATTAQIWKVAAKASSSIRPFSPQSPHALLSYVNIRARASPPLPYESIGNLILTTTRICFPENQPGLSNLMGEIRESIAKINSNHIDSFKGEIVQGAFDGILKRLKDLMDIIEEGDRCLNVTSLLYSGVYNIDFGWGMPIWFGHMNPGGRRVVSLNDTLKGGGVEATITLSFEKMEIFKNDEELLTYAIVNPSPLVTITYK